MGIETDLNVNPYYDDFDETKDYHRVLFKPAVPLQARELTQLQTILQNQIEKFGQFNLKEGSIVKGCGFTYTNDIKYAKILDKTSSGTDININLFGEGDFIRDNSNLVSRIVSTSGGLESQNPDLNTLFFNYINTGNTANKKAYAPADEVEIYPASTGIANVVFTGIPNDVFVTNTDSISVTSNLKGSGLSGHVVTTDGTNQYLSANITANGTGFSVDDLPSATIVASNGGVFTQGNTTSNTIYDFANAISNGQITVEVTLNKSGNVTIANTEFQNSNAEFNVLGSAFQMKVQDGVIFQKGTFQRFAEQSIIVSKYSSRPNELSVGVTTEESFVNSSIDTSLLDNASGFANENAPGADRLKLQPTLVVNTTADAVTSNNFLRLVEFQHGLPVKLNTKAQLSGLGEVIEQRLYETSGDYVIEPLAIGTEPIRGNTTHFSVAVGAGIGYNKGQRFELINTNRISHQKATKSLSIPNQEISINYGNYVEVDEYAGQFGIKTNDRVLLMGAAFNSVSAANGSTYDISSNTIAGFNDTNKTLAYAGTTGNVVGSARVRAMETLSSDTSKSTSKFNLYIYDIQMEPGKSFAKNAKSLFHYSGTEYTGTNSQTNLTHRGIADLVLNSSGKAKILDQQAQDRDMVFSVGQVGIKSISNNASFTFEDSTDGSFDSNGSATFEKDGTQNWNFGTADTTLTEAQENDLLLISNTTIVSTTENDPNTTTNGTTKITSVDVSDIFEGDYIRVANSSANAGIFQVVQKGGTNLIVDRNVPASSNQSISIAYPKGRAIPLKNRSTASAALSGSGQTLTVNLGRTFGSSWTADLIHKTKETSSPGITKQYKTSEIVIYPANNEANTVGPWSLGIPDGHKLVSVYASDNTIVQGSNAIANAIANGTMSDKTREFDLLNGQKGSKYGLSKLKLTPGSTYNVSSSGTIAATFRHFDNDSVGGYASFRSYAALIDDTQVLSTKIQTQDIPVLKSDISGIDYSLRDCIDFRPYVSATGTVEGTFLDADASVNPSSVEQISGNTITSSPNRLWSSSIEYYLPRRDSLIIQDGNLSIVYGQSSVNPQLPTIPSDSMQLGTLNVPVYPSLDSVMASISKRPDLAVKISSSQLKRYTMSDIKAIDQRVDNLEYYSSLNLLEKRTSKEVIPQRSNPLSDRFKNGFMVDNFVKPTTGNPLNTEYKAGFDTARALLTPRFEKYNLDLVLSSGGRARQIGDSVMTDHRVRRIIQQPNATQSRKCTSAFWQYNGTVQLYPDYLNHVDETISPEVQIDVDVATGTLSLLDELSKMLPLQTTEQKIISEEKTKTLLDSVVNPGGLTATETYEIVTTTEIEETNKGLTGDVSTTRKTVGEFVTDISFQPYIPGIDIRFIATGLRPGLRHYVYFDNVDVNSKVAPGEVATHIQPDLDPIQIASSQNIKALIRRKNSFGSALTANTTGGLSGIFRIPAATFFAGERKFAITDVSNLSQVGETVSAASTKFNCFNFGLSKTVVTQTTRQPILSSTETSNIYQAISNTIVEEVVTIPVDDDGGGPANDDPIIVPPDEDGGIRDICEQFNRSDLDIFDEFPERGFTKVIPLRVHDCEICTDSVVQDLRNWGINAHNRDMHRAPRESAHYRCAQYIDPLAQTFKLQDSMFAGAPFGYLKSVDVAFAKKHSSLGCTVEIREVINGVPGSSILPFGQTMLKSNQIVTSTDGSALTRINFKAPVGVETNKEYCFVIKPESNNPELEVFTSKAGQSELRTGRSINQDWGAGTLFLSSNDRQWTPYMDEDVKFTLNAAYFDATNSQISLVNDDYEFLKTDANGVSGSFDQGEEVFQLGTVATGNVTFASGSDTITAGTTDLSLLGISAGNKIVLENANSNYDVVEVSSANSTVIKLRGAPDITETVASSGKIRITPVGTFKQIDANTNTILINDSTATNSTFLFTSANTLVGSSSGATAVIGSIEDTNITYFEPRLYNNVPNATAIVTKLSATHSANNSLTEFERIKTNDRNYPDAPIKIKSKSNEIDGTTINKSLKLRYNFSSKNRYISPMIDLQSQSLLIYENVINNSVVDEHVPEKGQAAAKYISRTLTLGDGLDAEDIKVFVNAYRPAGTDIKVYAKPINQADDSGDNSWSELQIIQNKDKISSSENRNDTIEYSFEFNDAPQSTIKTGSVTFNNASPTITGVGTSFTTEFAVGDLVKIDNPPFDANTNYQVSMVTAIASDTSMTIGDDISIGTELDGRQISKVDAEYKNQVFRDPQSDDDNAFTVPYVATYYNSNNEKMIGYKYLSIKIIMTSDSTSKSPYLENYRAIAVSL